MLIDDNNSKNIRFFVADILELRDDFNKKCKHINIIQVDSTNNNMEYILNYKYR